MLGQAKAKAKAEAGPSTGKWTKAMRSMGKTFKEVVAMDLHPGFSDNATEKHSELPRKG